MFPARLALAVLLIAGSVQAHPPLSYFAAASNSRVDRYGDPLPPGAIARIGTVRFSGFLSRGPDAATMATLRENRVVLIDPKSGAEVRRLNGPDQTKFEVHAFQFSDDGAQVAYIGNDGIQVWNVRAGQIVGTIRSTYFGRYRGYMQPTRLQFLNDNRLIVASDYTPLQCFDISSGQSRWSIDQRRQNVRYLGYRPDHSALVVASKDGNDNVVRLISPINGNKVADFKLPAKVNPLSGAMSPDGEQVVFPNEDGKILRFALPGGAELKPHLEGKKPNRQFINAGFDPYTYMLFSPDGTKLAATDEEGVTLHLLGGEEKKKLRIGAERSWNWMASYVFSADSTLLWMHEPQGNGWRAYNTTTGAGQPVGNYERLADIQSIAVAPDGKQAVVASMRGTYHADLATGKRLRSTKPLAGGLFAAAFGGESLENAQAYAFSPDGKLLAGLRYRDLQVTEAASGKVVKTISLGNNLNFYRCEIAFSPDSKYVAVSPETDYEQRNKESFIRLMDVTTGKEAKRFRCQAGHAGRVQFSPDGRWLAFCARDVYERESSYTVFDMTTGRTYWSAADEVQAATFMPFGRTVALVSANSIMLWEPSAGAARLRLNVAREDAIQGVAVSPDGRWLAGIAGQMGRGVVWLWDMRSGKELPPLLGHTGAVTALAFAGNNKLVTGSDDATGLVWDLTDRIDAAPTPKVNESEMTYWWNQLDGDAAAAHRALIGLCAAGQPAVELVRARVRPPEAIDSAHIAQQLALLDSRQYAVRQNAARQLETMDAQAEPMLRRFAAEAPSAEARRQAERLVERLAGTALSAEQLRQFRAIELLTRIGTPAAREVLTELASKGDPAARLTQEAKAALLVLR